MGWEILLFVGSLLLSWFTRPKNKSAITPGEVEAGTADAGSTIGVLFGTRDINGSATCVWYGDRRAVAIKKKSGKK